MQIIEVGMLGVRASVLRLTRRDTPLRFDVFPMVHIGEPAFYTAVADRLRRCDLILAESVGGERARLPLNHSTRKRVGCMWRMKRCLTASRCSSGRVGQVCSGTQPCCAGTPRTPKTCYRMYWHARIRGGVG
ncbi:hypothetical protein AB0M79_14395 [Polymorphospora sp. NPDC051019]|uniref:hypothetical protein n=1 Tax=Polymorphospora sp. NPDC051019 TaxID=3155725 RepID=UPI00342B477E